MVNGWGKAVRGEGEADTRPRWITPELIAETVRVWKPRYGGRLTDAEAVEILVNTAQLVRASTWRVTRNEGLLAA